MALLGNALGGFFNWFVVFARTARTWRFTAMAGILGFFYSIFAYCNNALNELVLNINEIGQITQNEVWATGSSFVSSFSGTELAARIMIFTNTVFPLDDCFIYLNVLFPLFIACCIYRLIKSYIPTIS